MKTNFFYRGAFVALMMSTSVMAETKLKAVRADNPPVLDGIPDDAAWANAGELRLQAKGRGGPTQGKTTAVTLKAAYDDENLYILLRWEDASKDATHKSYVWNDEKSAYEVGSDREDNAALAFPIRGEFSADMRSGTDELWDVWHWKARRTGPAGYAMDRTHAFTSTKPEGKAKKFSVKNGKDVWIARPEDSGGSVTTGHPAPDKKQATAPAHYQAVTPSGSAADIRTGQSYGNGWWAVEFARKLKTGSADDAQFSIPGNYQLGVAVFDKSEHEYHYTAGPITLELQGNPQGSRGTERETTFTFDHSSTGRFPEGWSIRQTHALTVSAVWQILMDPTAPSKPNILALIKTENYNGTFNLAIPEETSFKDLDLSVKVKAVRGEEDQGGGPIWRCKDEDNYYICRFNPLEANFRLYFVKDGRRKQLQSAKVKTQPDQWYTVRVTMLGDQIACYLDGKKLLETMDDTFKQAGMVGLWTKADAVTSFDDLVVRPLVIREGAARNDNGGS